MFFRRSCPIGYVAPVLFLVAACAPRGYVKDPAPWLSAADWTKAETVRVELTEYRFTPQVLTFEEGLPYILQIANVGREKHYFVSDKFFRAVATRKAQVPSVVEIKAPRFTELEVYPGQALEFYFVAVRPGLYELTCTIPGHAQQGMTGAIMIRAKGAPPRKSGY